MSYHSGNQLINPSILFEKAQLTSGMHVADLGCGRTGHIVFPAAMVVGEKGIVYAVDILKNVLESVNNRANMEGFAQIHTVWADLERPNSIAIPEKTVDIVFLINVLFHFDKYEGVLNEAKRLLKEKARIVIVDWAKRLGGLGPNGDSFVDFSQVLQWSRQAGFAVQGDGMMGSYHKYLILFRHD